MDFTYFFVKGFQLKMDLEVMKWRISAPSKEWNLRIE